MSQRVAIVGIGQTDFKYRRDDVSFAEMCTEAVKPALEDAGITHRDVDATLMSNMELFEGHF